MNKQLLYAEVTHSESLEPMAVFRTPVDGRVWAQPKSMFGAGVPEGESSGRPHNLFRHFKTGNIYDVLHETVFHSETLEELVVYKARKTGEIWIRPKYLFFGVTQYGIETVHRFSKLEGKELEEELKRIGT